MCYQYPGPRYIRMHMHTQGTGQMVMNIIYYYYYMDTREMKRGT